MKTKNPKAEWYIDLMERYETLVKELGLSKHEAGEIKNFLLATAREQYMAGNRSGIAWMHQREAMSKE